MGLLKPAYVYQFTEAQLANFWDAVDQSGGPNACWPWTRALGKNGYGQVCINQLRWYSHRFALFLKTGYLGHDCMHACDNRPCCNPSHLSWGTRLMNVRDMISKGRERRGSRHHRSKIDEAAVRDIRESYARGEIQKSIAARYGLARQTVGEIVRGEIWVHVTEVSK